MFTGFGQDLRQTIRSLRQSPVVFVAAVVTLAVAIGANTAVFSVVNTLLIRPLPVRQPAQLYWVSSDYAASHGFRAGAGWNHAMWEALRDRSGAFAGSLAWRPQRFVLGSGAGTEPAEGFYASGGFFSTLGIQAQHGRLFTADDDRVGGGAAGLVVVISARLWQRRFARNPDIVGTPLIVNGVPVTIAGVAATSFLGLEAGKPFDVALPLGAEPAVQGRTASVFKPRSYLLQVMLRLMDSQTVAAATRMLRSVQPEIVPANAPAFAFEPFTLVPLPGGTGPASPERLYGRPLVVLLGGVSLVLIIASINIANLMLSRGIARSREIGLRLAMGAPRRRLMRGVVTESLVLAIAGGLLGLWLATSGSQAIVSLLSLQMQPALDWRVIAFAAAITVAALVLFSTTPAWNATRVAPIETMNMSASRVRGAPRHLSRGLVVLQIALSLVLVVAAGLLVATFRHLARTPLGFDADRVLVADIDAGRSAHVAHLTGEFGRRLIVAAAAVPGVERAAASAWTPLSGQGTMISLSGADVLGGSQSSEVNVLTNFVSPGWFPTYGTALTAGRDFTDSDTNTSQEVIVVNDAFARRFLSGRPVVGAVVGQTLVVGLVRDAVSQSGERIPGMISLAFRQPVPPTMYAPVTQMGRTGRPPSNRVFLSVRARDGDPVSLAPAVRSALTQIDPDLALEFRPLADYVRASLAQERMSASVSLFFGVISALLAAVGLYGVTSYAAGRRTAEIGVRMALGATPASVIGLTLRQAMTMVVIGVAVGLAASLAMTRTIASMVFGISPLDPATFIIATMMLLAVAMLAAFVPAYRASRIDPVTALRAD